MVIPSDLLKKEVSQALGQQPARPVNLNRFRHTHIVKGLYDLVFGDGFSRTTLKRFRVTFNDGTETNGFPVFCLPRPQDLDAKAFPLRLGLNSGRHPELDQMIEFYLFRNTQVKAWETAAEQEKEAFYHTIKLLSDTFWEKGGVIECFHTGLEPIVTGFYRAVVENALERIRNNMPRLQVVPMIFSPRGVNLRQHLQSQDKNPEILEERLLHLKKQLRSAIEELPEFLSLEINQHHSILRWNPRRPMWSTERDYLHFRFPSLKLLTELLYEGSQYRKLPHWG